RYYSQLYWTSRPGENPESVYPHKDPSPRFPELLAKAGVATVTFTGMPGLVNDYGSVRGFSEERFVPGRNFAGAHEIMPPLLQRLAAPADGPLFLYAHFTDAHAPYDRAGTHGSQFERYVRELGLVDAQIGRLLDLLRDKGLEGRTTVIVSADHGEAF